MPTSTYFTLAITKKEVLSNRIRPLFFVLFYRFYLFTPVWFFFLPGTENLQVFWENGTEKQAFCTMFFFCGSDIGKDFPIAKDLRFCFV